MEAVAAILTLMLGASVGMFVTALFASSSYSEGYEQGWLDSQRSAQ
jgi:hypothetical protein